VTDSHKALLKLEHIPVNRIKVGESLYVIRSRRIGFSELCRQIDAFNANHQAKFLVEKSGSTIHVLRVA
jgi:hypothetical protein